MHTTYAENQNLTLLTGNIAANVFFTAILPWNESIRRTSRPARLHHPQSQNACSAKLRMWWPSWRGCCILSWSLPGRWTYAPWVSVRIFYRWRTFQKKDVSSDEGLSWLPHSHTYNKITTTNSERPDSIQACSLACSCFLPISLSIRHLIK